MRYCHFEIDPNKPDATILLKQLDEEFRSIGLVMTPSGVLEYDETDEVLMEKLKAIFAKYPKEFGFN